jgi:DNA polymerase
MFFLTFHPAATIYNQELIQLMDQDIAALAKALEEIKNGQL